MSLKKPRLVKVYLKDEHHTFLPGDTVYSAHFLYAQVQVRRDVVLAKSVSGRIAVRCKVGTDTPLFTNTRYWRTFDEAHAALLKRVKTIIRERERELSHVLYLRNRAGEMVESDENTWVAVIPAAIFAN